jgi:Rieske Fe-S protein
LTISQHRRTDRAERNDQARDGNSAGTPCRAAGGKVFPDQQVVMTQPSQGTFACLSAVCTHQGCTVDEVKDGTNNCPCHGSNFKIADSVVADVPATKPLEKKTITVAADNIALA